LIAVLLQSYTTGDGSGWVTVLALVLVGIFGVVSVVLADPAEGRMAWVVEVHPSGTCDVLKDGEYVAYDRDDLAEAAYWLHHLPRDERPSEVEVVYPDGSMELRPV
jgi:hypothetical protein